MLTKRQKQTVEEIRDRWTAIVETQAVKDVHTLLHLVDQLHEDAQRYERQLQEWLNDTPDY